MAGWLQLLIEIDPAHADAVSELALDAGAQSITLQDAASELLIEPVPGSHPLWQKIRLVALFPEQADLAPLQESIRDHLCGLQIPMHIEALSDSDWESAWRDHFNPMRFGARLWVCPAGADCPQQDAVVVTLDPGAAFGTGTHATTAMCLEWLDRHPPVGQTVIDYGCGSGILAIAAARLGAVRVYAIDIDERAVEVTRDNALLNGVADKLIAALPDALTIEPAQLVIANILANPLQELAAQLCGYLYPGATILLTGILDHQAADVQYTFQRWIEFDHPHRRDEWVLLSGTRRSIGG
jgi:ribosomal protein L11 methyltransferase